MPLPLSLPWKGRGREKPSSRLWGSFSNLRFLNWVSRLSYDWRKNSSWDQATTHGSASWRGLERVTLLLESLLLPLVQGESRKCVQARYLPFMWLELFEVNPTHLHPGKSPVIMLAQSSISRMKLSWAHHSQLLYPRAAVSRGKAPRHVQGLIMAILGKKGT